MSIFESPKDHWLRVAHKHSSNHRGELEESFQCGCFHCKSFFKPTKIKEWIDEGTTAMCPKCGIDSVIGDASNFDITEKFLDSMHQAWF